MSRARQIRTLSLARSARFVCVCARTCVCICVCVRARVYVCMRACARTYIFEHAKSFPTTALGSGKHDTIHRARTHKCTHTRACVRAHTHTRTHARTRFSPLNLWCEGISRAPRTPPCGPTTKTASVFIVATPSLTDWWVMSVQHFLDNLSTNLLFINFITSL